VRDRRFRTLRQDDADPVAAFQAEAGERVGEPVGLLLQIQKVYAAVDPASILPIQGEAERSGECRPQQAVRC